MRGLTRVVLVACLAVFGAGCTSDTQSPSPSPTTTLADFERIFPSAGEVGEVLGLEVEAMGIMGDMGQYWEGTEFAPGALVSTQLQHYRWPAVGKAEDSDDAFASVSVEIDRFRSVDDAARYGGEIASSITDPLADFPTQLLADLVATGTWTSVEGFGGSTIVARTGPIVVIVTAARTGATEMETASEAVTKLVLDRLSGE
jgi:hypothetical protein